VILVRALLNKRRDQAIKKIQELFERMMVDVVAATFSNPCDSDT
jgi:hypothetical protein